MAKQTAGFVDQHIEKVVLGVCGALFLGTAIYYFALGPYKVDGQAPKDLVENARSVAERTQDAVRRAPAYVPPKEDANKPSAEPLKELAKWFGTQAEGLISIAKLDPRSPRTQTFSTPLLVVEGVADEDKLTLAKLVAPSAPVVISGHAYLDMPQQIDFETLYKSGPTSRVESRERSWVSVAAQVNLAEQFRTFLAAGYPHGMSMSMPIIRIHLQRKLADEKNADWEEVTPYTIYKRISPPEAEFMPNGTLAGASSKDVEKFATMIRLGQRLIARAPLPRKSEGTRGDEPFAPPLPFMEVDPGQVVSADPNPIARPGANNPADAAAGQRAKDWIRDGTKALAGQRPYGAPDPELAMALARAAAVSRGLSTADVDRAKKLMQDAEAAAKKANRPIPSSAQEEPEHFMPILAHDLEVTPGRTYIYRMRYEILNPLMGSDRVRNPADGRRVTLVSDWSEPSRPIEVKSDLFYFLTKADPAKQTADFTVFKKVSGGEMVSEKFTVSPGDIVGVKKRGSKSSGPDFSTHKLCVFIDEAGSDKRVILADAVDGSLIERLVSRDSNDKRLKELSANSGRRGR